MENIQSQWTLVYSNTIVYKIDLIQGLLRSEGIESVTVNKKDSLYHFGEVELYIAPVNVIKAKKIIKEAEIE